MTTATLPDLIADAQTTEESFLRHIFVRDQMADWSKRPLVMARADGVHYWDVNGKRYLDALSGIYVVALGHNNRRVIEAIRKQLDTLHFSPPMHGTNPPAAYRGPFAKSYRECGTTRAPLVGDVIDMEDAATVAAVMVEPIGHTGGIIDPPPEYLPILREVCDRHNVLLIFDEIITGVGRTGHLFAAETFGVVPDVLCTAKGLSCGRAPLAAIS